MQIDFDKRRITLATEDGKEIYGLLPKFINDKFTKYNEPSRKGTPRGEAIGFSLVKYAAVLLSLTSIKIQDQAKELDVSYGLLRKWRAEEQFNETSEKYSKEFANFLVRRFFSFDHPHGYPLGMSSDFLKLKDFARFFSWKILGDKYKNDVERRRKTVLKFVELGLRYIFYSSDENELNLDIQLYDKKLIKNICLEVASG